MKGARVKQKSNKKRGRSVWTAEERRAWAPPERLTPAEWATRHRRLSRAQSPIPGRWQHENAPYLRGIMNLAVGGNGILQLNVMKSTQVGASEASRNLIAWAADTDPVPMGLTLPAREKGRNIIQNRIIPLFKTTAKLRALFTERAHDVKSEQITLNNGFRLHLMWSGSASSMSADPVCRVINDEVDKYELWVGREADAITLTAERLKAFGPRAIQVNLSSPTTRAGHIWRLFDGSDVKLYFYVPCPHCGTYQRLVWSQIKWAPAVEAIEDKYKRAAAAVRGRDLVWYECEQCKSPIHERERPAMVRAGRWASEDGTVTDAEQVRVWPRGVRVGMHIWQAYTLWDEQCWAKIVAQWFRAEGDREARMAFRTQTLGEPHEQAIIHVGPGLFESLSTSAELDEGIVPAWVYSPDQLQCALLATADTQKDHFYVVIRAWGAGMRSARVWHGIIETFRELRNMCFAHPFEVEANRLSPQTCLLLLIDTGGTIEEDQDRSRTAQVYEFALRTGRRVRCIKGKSISRPGEALVKRTRGFFRSERPTGVREKFEVPLYLLDTIACHDELADMIARGEGKDSRPKLWFLNKRNDEAYNHHMANAQKILDRRGSQIIERWIPVTSGARYDYRDCEVYQVAGARMCEIHSLPEPEELAEPAPKAEAPEAAAVPETESSEPARRPKGADARRRSRRELWEPRPL